MKKLLLMFLLSAAYSLQAQQAPIKYPMLDGSPVDILYYPLKVASAKAGEADQPVIKILYARPQKKSREVFGVLEPYGKVWRLGANENTEIKFYKEVKIQGKQIKAGTYSLFAIPYPDKWIIILNATVDKWGAFSYNEQKDVARFEVPSQQLSQEIEALSMSFLPSSTGADLYIAWDKTQVNLAISF